MSELHAGSRSERLDRAIHALLAQTPELEAAAVVSFDGLPMAAALPPTMDEDRVAAMSAALLSLGERAAQGLGRGELSQVYIEGDNGTVFLVSADDEAVLVAVAARGAKAGMMLFEVRRAAAVVAEVLRDEVPSDEVLRDEVPRDEVPRGEVHAADGLRADEPSDLPVAEHLLQAVPPLPDAPAWPPVTENPAWAPAAQAPAWAPAAQAPAWTSYAPSGSVMPGDAPTWS
ncbi:MAG: roadblock/LC7 domain-containing protein [Pseudorhodobacter sp.]|nr:roadblock/LC7 domain-containing protein [Frankiaceae bacterium]